MNPNDALALTTSVQTLRALIPELMILLVATVMITLGAFTRQPRRVYVVSALVTMFVALISLYGVRTTVPEAYATVALNDAFAGYARLGFLLAGFVLVILAHDQVDDARAAEFFGALMMIQAGAMLVCTANDLVFLFVSLEMVSIPTYVLLYLGRRNAMTQEAATKYFFLSVFSSGLLLFGLAYLYGIAGVSNLKGLTFLANRLVGVPNTLLSVVAIVFVMAGLGFRVAAVPFHFYAPDVYQGSATIIAALLSWVPKGVGFVAMIRTLTAVFAANDALSQRALLLVWILAVATMTLGNTVALRQTNLKRLLAYSSIAHAGYLLIGIAAAFRNQPVVGNQVQIGELPLGTEGVLLYLATYALMTLGAFGVLILLSTPERAVESIDDLNGLSRTHPVPALALTLCLFSLAGVPPLAGFWGKLWVFSSAIGSAQAREEDASLMVTLVIIGGLNAAIGAYYYLRIVVAMYLRPAEAPLQPRIAWPTAIAVGACATLSLFLGCYPHPLEVASREAGIAAITSPEPPPAPAPVVSEPMRTAQSR
jgi:NADH-quinone oxidoreductase subunit N